MSTHAVGWLVATAGLVLAPALAWPDDPKEGSAQGQPGPVHRAMARYAGEFTTLTKFWMKPGDRPVETKGTAKLRSILGGRFLLEENSGAMLGQPFQGLRLTGYNSATEKFESTWVYTGGTATMSLVGTSKDGGKTVSYTATYEAQKGVKTTLYVVTRQIDDDHFTIELFAKTPDGKKGPAFETSYTRKK
jgi:hypothetical protein